MFTTKFRVIKGLVSETTYFIKIKIKKITKSMQKKKKVKS